MANEVNNGTWTATLDDEIAVAFETVYRMVDHLRKHGETIEYELDIDLLELCINAAKQRLKEFDKAATKNLGSLRLVRAMKTNNVVGFEIGEKC